MCKYYIVISNTLVGAFLDGLFLLLAVILSELHDKPRRKDWVRDITLLTARFPSYVFFLLSSSTPSPFPSDALAEWQLQRYIYIYIYILLRVVCCAMISWVNGRKYETINIVSFVYYNLILYAFFISNAFCQLTLSVD